ncbi:MAG: ADP-ribose pyrophosphatase [Myxococcaceae bacterium]|nr:ADP-ribose pyrophosphatase [Myxococcaceae bacterium]
MTAVNRPPDWLRWAREMQAIAQNGLTFARDPFDVQRYEALRALASEVVTTFAESVRPSVSEQVVSELGVSFTSGVGYATPKLDVRAAVFRESEDGPRILLVRERSDGNWTLPGGWADVGQSVAQAVEKEATEESGYVVRATKLLAVLDRDRQGHPPHPEHVWKVFVRCELVGGVGAGDGLETDAVGFYGEAALPPLSLTRVLPAQIARLFEHYRNPELPTDFD